MQPLLSGVLSAVSKVVFLTDYNGIKFCFSRENGALLHYTKIEKHSRSIEMYPRFLHSDYGNK